MPTTERLVSSAERPADFRSLGLSETMLQVVDDLGYSQPTPVQAAAIPEVLAGRDLLAAAQTGTGKTAAFLLPTRDRLGLAGRHEGPHMLVITPTRELAQQIEDVARTVSARTRHRCVTVVGGVGYGPQVEALRRGCDVLVATPGRLVDLIGQGVCDLGGVRVLVMDEADRMLDMGFLPQVRKIVARVPRDRQTLLLSATLDDKAIEGVSDLVRDPARVEIAHRGTVAETIDQYVLPVSLEAKNALLAKVLDAEGPRRVIVFCRTKHRSDACCRRLRHAGITCAPIHGNRSQNQRERALRDFRAGDVDVLVATDVLARGIDISDVRYVVNFDVPADPEDYVHRIGRTGRAGETGWALTFVTVDDRDDLLGIERLMGKVVPPYQPRKPLDTGSEPPELDPDRTADAPRTGRPGKKRSRGSRGRRQGGDVERHRDGRTGTARSGGGRRREAGRQDADRGSRGDRSHENAPARTRGGEQPRQRGTGRHPGDRGGSAGRH